MSERCDRESFENCERRNKVLTNYNFSLCLLLEIEEKLASLPGLALSATAEAIGQGSDWPFVTLNMFHEQAINAQALSGALWVGISPVVTNSTLLEWEVYVQGDASVWM